MPAASPHTLTGIPGRSTAGVARAGHRAGVAIDPMGPGLTPQLETREFATLRDYSAATGQDRNSVLVDYDIFVKVPQLNAQDFSTIQKIYDAKDLDFSLKPGSAAEDKGVVLPNVNEDFLGAAPDLGALERGRPAPHYGPRP